MKILTLLISLILFGSIQAQINIDCSNSIPWSEDCVSINPPQASQELYYSFTSTSPNISFSYIYLTNCQGIQTDYTLYDVNCNVIESSPDGSFILTPNTDYIIGFSIICQTGNIITICPSELIQLPIELISFGLKYNALNDITTFNWITGSETNSETFTLSKSINCLEWSEIGQISGNGYGSSYTFKNKIGKSGIMYYKLDWNGGSKVIAFEYPERKILKAYNLIGQEL